jgi:hypothetical protein
MNTGRLLALVSCLTLWASTTRADERFLPYIDWLVANSEYEYNGEPLPEVVTMPMAWLQVEVYGPEQVAQSEMNGTELPTINGAYNPLTNQIIFPDTVDPWAWEHADTMVHETLHYLQKINGVTAECVNALEREAYELHWQWAQEHNHPSEEPNWLFVFMLEMSCQDFYR